MIQGSPGGFCQERTCYSQVRVIVTLAAESTAPVVPKTDPVQGPHPVPHLRPRGKAERPQRLRKGRFSADKSARVRNHLIRDDRAFSRLAARLVWRGVYSPLVDKAEPCKGKAVPHALIAVAISAAHPILNKLNRINVRCDNFRGCVSAALEIAPCLQKPVCLSAPRALPDRVAKYFTKVTKTIKSALCIMDAKTAEFLKKEEAKYKKNRDKARKQGQRAKAKAKTDEEKELGAFTAPKIPKINIELKEQTHALLEAASKRIKSQLKWRWVRINDLKKEDDQFERRIFAEMTAFLDGKSELPPYVAEAKLDKKRKAQDHTGSTPDAKKKEPEPNPEPEPEKEKKEPPKFKITLRASDGMTENTWNVLRARVWDVQDDEDKEWPILAIEGKGEGPRYFIVALEDKAAQVAQWLTAQNVGEVRFTTTLLRMGNKGGAGGVGYVPGLAADAGLFQFRYLLSKQWLLACAICPYLQACSAVLRRRRAEGRPGHVPHEEQVQRRVRDPLRGPRRRGREEHEEELVQAEPHLDHARQRADHAPHAGRGHQGAGDLPGLRVHGARVLQGDERVHFGALQPQEGGPVCCRLGKGAKDGVINAIAVKYEKRKYNILRNE